MPPIGAVMVLFGMGLVGESPRDDDVVNRLFANGEYPKVIRLSARQKAEAVNRLRIVERTATGKRLQEVSFLLAALDSEYSRHRDFLVGILRGCANHVPDCDEDTANLLVGLYRAGHRDVLCPLLAAAGHSDGAVAELLAAFYADLIMTAPSDFLVCLSRLSPSDRRAVCTLPAYEDVEPPRRALSKIGNNAALACLRDLETAIEEAAKDGGGEQQRPRE